MSVGLGVRDFTEYKYKYWPSLMQTLTNNDKGRTYDAVCVKKCPMDLPDITTEAYINQTVLECMVNNDAKSCMRPNYNSTVLLRFCVPELKTTAETLNKLAVRMGGDDFLGDLIVDFQSGWWIILVMSGITLVVTILYIFLLQWIAKPILYITLFLLTGGLLGAGAYLMYLFTRVADGV